MPIGVCKLCLQTKDLQNSHYMPKGAYKINRAPALKNASPVVLSDEQLLQSTAQLNFVTTCLPQKPQYFSGFRSCQTLWTMLKNASK